MGDGGWMKSVWHEIGLGGNRLPTGGGGRMRDLVGKKGDGRWPLRDGGWELEMVEEAIRGDKPGRPSLGCRRNLGLGAALLGRPGGEGGRQKLENLSKRFGVTGHVR
ncbi:hypothetical protein ACLOJK_027749, partial [Asimina triloba]